MTAPKSVAIYVKINSFGVIFICVVALYISALGFYSLSNTDFIYSKEDYIKYLDLHPTKESRVKDYKGYIGMVESNFPPLMGILGGGFYFHNISLPVIRNSKNPENNARDVFIGYFLVFICYCFVGTLGYYGFNGK